MANSHLTVIDSAPDSLLPAPAATLAGPRHQSALLCEVILVRLAIGGIAQTNVATTS